MPAQSWGVLVLLVTEKRINNVSSKSVSIFLIFLTFGRIVTLAALSCLARISSSLRSMSTSLTGWGDIVRQI